MELTEVLLLLAIILITIVFTVEIVILRYRILKIENLPSNKDFLKQLKTKKGKK